VQRIVVKSKIHRATVTRADLDYEGSCSIDAGLMRLADILPGEQVHVLNLANGERAVTYAIEGEPGEIGLNGAIAHLGKIGDLVILLSYAQYDDAELGRHVPRIVRVDAGNRARTEALTP
jgi:aspartate 1-decarboxylase